MPLEIGVWGIDNGKCQKVPVVSLNEEGRLEDYLDADISIASPNWMVIGRQVLTAFGNYIDLLAIDRDGNLVVIELKRDKTPRDVVAQVLDYASWVRKLTAEHIGEIFHSYMAKYHPAQKSMSIDEVFRSRFQVKDMPETLNERHELVVVASSFDESTERIVRYLSEEHNVPVNAIFFRIFRDGEKEYLTRAWLLDPVESVIVHGATQNEDWNGEYYVSFGHDDTRNWDDACKYGFISAGGGTWYTKTLHMLEVGNRVWVNVPARGYVGVGIVKERCVKVDKFMVTQKDGTKVPISGMPLKATNLMNNSADIENAEYMVAIDWQHTVTLNHAVKEKGFFGNQNTVCQPTTSKWNYTVQRLREIFNIK